MLNALAGYSGFQEREASDRVDDERQRGILAVQVVRNGARGGGVQRAEPRSTALANVPTSSKAGGWRDHRSRWCDDGRSACPTRGTPHLAWAGKVPDGSWTAWNSLSRAS